MMSASRSSDRHGTSIQDKNLPIHKHFERLLHCGMLECLGRLICVQASLGDMLLAVVEKGCPFGD